jgi:hypothetical protein
VVREGLLIDIVDHKLIRHLSNSLFVNIPRDIEILCSFCFSVYESLESVLFESDSRLTRIESQAFPRFAGPIRIPSGVLFIAHDAIGKPSRLSLCDENSCPEFGRSGGGSDHRAVRSIFGGLWGIWRAFRWI